MRFRYGSKSTVLCIPDLQIPFHHPDSIEFLVAVYYQYDCNKVVCLGDEVDQYGLSRYDHDPDADSPGVEEKKTRAALEELYDCFPDVKACLSNHTGRVVKKAMVAGIPKHYMKSVKEFMRAPDGWEWADRWELDGVVYEHGEAAGGMQPHRLIAQSNQKNTVIGHHHAVAGIEYFSNWDKTLWGMCVGCLVDFDTPAFAYAKTSRNKVVLSCGVVHQGSPIIVPMETNSRGRWTGRLA